jgi:ribose/xylose/arabinose/galactoside ABC-type transport system permease subunit
MADETAIGPTAPRERWGFALPVETGVAVVLAAISLWLYVSLPEFKSWDNTTAILTSVAEIGILAAGMTLVIASGGIDISVGSIVGLCGVLFGLLTATAGWNPLLAAVASVAAGASCGLVNGVLIARFKVPPIIATLAMFSAARAAAYILSEKKSILLPKEIRQLGYGFWLGVPLPAWAALFALLVAGLLIKRTTFGRSLLAIGGNREAAFLSGIKTRRTEILVYVLSGLFAGVAALVTAGRGGTAVPDAGKYYELQAITAVVLGGTPVTGGRATMTGAALGVLTIGVLRSGVMGYGKDAMVANVLLAVVLLLAVEVDRWRRARALKA